MDRTYVAITYEEVAGGVRITCFLTEDPRIDSGLRHYLDRQGLVLNRYKPDVVGSQMFTVMHTSTMRTAYVLELIHTYYASWGKTPGSKPVGDVMR